MIARRAQTFCLLLFVAIDVSLARGQDNRVAPNRSNGELAASSNPSTEPLTVVCKGDQLTILANNATLGSILNEVQRCTGAKIDIPRSAAEIRIYDTIGPRTIQEVLPDLLTATGYNFVIEYSDSDVRKIEEVLLTARASAPDENLNEPSLTPARRAFLKMRQDALTEAGITTDDASSVPEERQTPSAISQSPATSGETPAASPSASPDESQRSTPAPPPGETSAPASPAPEAASPVSQPKAIDDQISNMQQMFEQRRQMMQATPQPPHN